MDNHNLSNPLDHMAGSDKNDVALSPEALNYLRETGKWSKFLAIVGFVFIGIMVIAGLFAGTIFSTLGQGAGLPFPSFLIGGIYVFMGAVYFFPVYYLFNFSTSIEQALATRDTNKLTSAFSNLKAHYKFIGILMIVTIGLYILMAVGGFLSALFI